MRKYQFRYPMTLAELRKTKVFIYRNLNQKCWSVKAKEGPYKDKVVCHIAGDIHIRNPQFHVNEKERQRVIREKRKNVHAGVIGHFCNKPDIAAAYYEPILYDPYKYKSFVWMGGKEPVKSCQYLEMSNNFKLYGY